MAGVQAARGGARFRRWCEKKLTEDGIGGPRIYTLYAPSPLLFFDVAEEKRAKRTRGGRKRERGRERERESREEGKGRSERAKVKEAKEKWKKKSPN